MWGQAYTHFVCMSSMNCFPCAFLHKYIHFYACIHSQVDNNTTIRDLTNLCVMVLLQQTISWALAFQSVVWDVARIAEIQIIHWDVARIAGIKDIHFHFVRASIAKTSCYIAFKGEWPDRSLSDGACNHIFSFKPKISSWMVVTTEEPTWGRPCKAPPWGSSSWSPQRRSSAAKGTSLRGRAPTGNLRRAIIFSHFKFFSKEVRNIPDAMAKRPANRRRGSVLMLDLLASLGVRQRAQNNLTKF